ncbi:FAD-dependent oxidoreductase [Clostridium uliginosum]|uniref:L-2-hydroxyglutarate oxidase LhgO n=1 Tax=Clostridium uliginosum TaxID=119641 RepID=A0A1I1LGW1_9CLOT|nr:FAD-dependent oxidoreductase [Clostridium uliginosum]SFC69603.1 L-2-hydroxyglutarate oxidase LhgO [Clostridium uliginosum]
MDYDILILGGGIIGCAVAYELSKYNINIALIEKDYDVADDISFINTAIIYDGSETSDVIMAGLENIGMKLIERACKKFSVPYNKTGALRMASNNNNKGKLDTMYERAKERGIEGVYIIEDNDKLIYDIEPNLNIKVDKALYSENIAVISPYDLAISYAEVAADNGVNFKLEEIVMDIKNISGGFKVTTNKNKFTCKVVVNTIPDEIYIDNNKEDLEKNNDYKNMNYILFENKLEKHINTILIDEIDNGIFVINNPTISEGNLIGIKSNHLLTLDEGIDISKNIFPEGKKEFVSNIFTEVYNKDVMVIDDSKLNSGYIKVTGTHYGKITIAPAIAMMIKDTLKNSLNITRKKDYVDKRREVYRFKEMSNEERNEIISLDKKYGNIVCVCNNISEGEVVDCIRRPLGARTVEGVKRRTGVGLGNCNGSHCNIKIIKILAREMNKNILDIVEDSKDSNILSSRIKEFKEI